MTVGYRSDSSLQITSIENLIHYIAYKKFPFLSMFMNSNPSNPSFMGNITDTNHKWNEKKLKTCRGELQADCTYNATTIYELEQYTDYIDGKTIIRIDDEFISVTTAGAYGSGKRALTVVRGFNSSTAAAHKAGSQIIIMNPHEEGHTPTRNDAQYGGQQENYTQIFYKVLQMSGTSQAVKTYGDELKIDKQLADKIPSLLEDFENAMIYGTKYFDGTSIRMMGGLLYWIASAYIFDNKGAQFTLETFYQDVWDRVKLGQDPSDLCMACGNEIILALTDMKAKIVQETMTINELNYDLDRIVVPGVGKVTVLPHPSMYPAYEYSIFPRKNVRAKALRPLSKDKLAKTGDHERWQAVMEATGEFINFQKGAAVRRKNISR